MLYALTVALPKLAGVWQLAFAMHCCRREHSADHESLRVHACMALANPREFIFAKSMPLESSVEVQALWSPTPTRKNRNAFLRGNCAEFA
jgi:hypothetical protein